MPLQPPSFGSLQYWNNRFTSNSNPFEWLEAPTALDPYLVNALKETGDQVPEILHIGCGTSLLSFHLRAHVEQPCQIHNLDYSEVAIDVGRRREIDIFDVEGIDEETIDESGSLSGEAQAKMARPVPQPGPEDTARSPFMRWSSANLLSHNSLLNACNPSTYSVIVDKSTSDSIACADDIYVPLPYHIRTAGKTTPPHLTQSSEPVHPLHILAIHLAAVVKPKARWIALSYSQDRYPFLNRSTTEGTASTSAVDSAIAELDGFADELDDDLDNIPREMVESGFPDPSILWTLKEKVGITTSLITVAVSF